MKPGQPSDELLQLDLARGQKRTLIEAGSPFKIANNEWGPRRMA